MLQIHMYHGTEALRTVQLAEYSLSVPFGVPPRTLRQVPELGNHGTSSSNHSNAFTAPFDAALTVAPASIPEHFVDRR
jgi:hypothetical protein